MCKLYSITKWSLEINKFAFMRMEDGSVRGVDFQNGRMKGYKSVEDYVFALQDGKCACCGTPIHDIHHIWPRHKHGSDGPDNRIGLCDGCYHLIHTGELDIDKVGEAQKYGALSILNQAIPYILNGLIDRFGEENVHTCFGWQTKMVRKELHLPKEHHMDAVAIGAVGTGIKPVTGDIEHFEVKQYRRQDRAIIKSQTERAYKEKYVNDKGKLAYRTVAKNRKPREEQEGLALNQWFDKKFKKYGLKEAERQRSQLKLVKSKRKYNIKDRLMPGAIFIYKGERLVLKHREANGFYFIAEGSKNRIRSSECKVIQKNQGLVYL